MGDVKGKNITVGFDGARCIHARRCVTGAPSVFRANVKGEWIDPNGDAADHIAEIAHNCPSGAITYQRHDGKSDETAPRVNTARLIENGPVAVHAPMTIAGSDIGFRATLCRCGASQNKPFCDGAHAKAGFAATGEPEAGKTDDLEARDGVLEITPIPDGPLGVKGNLEVMAGSGRLVDRVTKCFLCRCGASKTKPYCDGSHKDIGFKAD